MKYSGIGGQSVMEGVMMRNGKDYAIAVRKPDNEIEVKVEKGRGSLFNDRWMKIPLVRGVLSFIDSLVLGMSTLMFSASFFEEEEVDEDSLNDRQRKREEKRAKKLEEKPEDPEKEEKKESALMGFVLVLSLVLAIGIFMILPYYLSQVFRRFVTDNTNIVAIFEGVLRIAIFVAYIYLISLMDDIQRTFMYHGAEHKCINCIEHGMDLTVENVRKSSREHKRCGTSFMVFVIVITVILYMFIRVDSHALRIVIRIALIPVIAGVSFELLRAAGRTDNKVIQAMSKPGMWMQRMTVKEPDDSMIEVGIASVEAVFDWRTFVKELRAEEGIPEPEESAAEPEGGEDNPEPEQKERIPEAETEESYDPSGLDEESAVAV